MGRSGLRMRFRTGKVADCSERFGSIKCEVILEYLRNYAPLKNASAPCN
jgi:hypothetical protein